LEERIQLKRINDAVTLLDDHSESTCYLVTGSRQALLIDTANEPVDMRALCTELTDLPITVVNTHGHCDHVFGNLYFDEAWLHPDDFALHNEHFAFAEIREIMRVTGRQPSRLRPLTIGQAFDLGGFSLEVVALVGHTRGSVGLLDREHRILFSGDALNGHIWMQLNESTPIATLRETLLTLKREHGAAYDHLLTGHGNGLEPAVRVDDLLRGCNELLAGKGEDDPDYSWFGGVCKAHAYDGDPGHCIVYTQDKL